VIRRHDGGSRQQRLLLVGVSVLIAAVSLTALAISREGTTSAAPAPALKIDAPAQVMVGEVIEIQISVTNAVDVAGYEMNLLYDPTVAHLNDLKQRQNDVKKLGRDVQAVGPVQLANGVSFGAFSCPVDTCTQASKPHNAKGAHGTVKLGVVRLVADSAGTLTIDLSRSRFVDASGNAVSVNLGSGTLTIQVIAGQ